MTDRTSGDQSLSSTDKPHSTTAMEPHTKGLAEAGEADKLPVIGSPDTGAEQVTTPKTKPK